MNRIQSMWCKISLSILKYYFMNGIQLYFFNIQYFYFSLIFLHVKIASTNGFHIERILSTNQQLLWLQCAHACCNVIFSVFSAMSEYFNSECLYFGSSIKLLKNSTWLQMVKKTLISYESIQG